MVNYTKLHQWKKEKSERLRGEGMQIKFIDLRFERWWVEGFRKSRKGKKFHKLHVHGIDAASCKYTID